MDRAEKLDILEDKKDELRDQLESLKVARLVELRKQEQSWIHSIQAASEKKAGDETLTRMRLALGIVQEEMKGLEAGSRRRTQDAKEIEQSAQIEREKEIRKGIERKIEEIKKELRDMSSTLDREPLRGGLEENLRWIAMQISWAETTKLNDLKQTLEELRIEVEKNMPGTAFEEATRLVEKFEAAKSKTEKDKYKEVIRAIAKRRLEELRRQRGLKN